MTEAVLVLYASGVVGYFCILELGESPIPPMNVFLALMWPLAMPVDAITAILADY